MPGIHGIPSIRKLSGKWSPLGAILI